MLSKIRFVANTLPKSPCPQQLKINLNRSFFQTTQCQQNSPTPPAMEIVDVNMDDLFPDDSQDNTGTITSAVDIDPWVDEETSKQGTVDCEYYQKDIKYFAPPDNRSGAYKFKGIEIWLPKKMLSQATYRYGLDEGEEGLVPDDTRVCKYENNIE